METWISFVLEIIVQTLFIIHFKKRIYNLSIKRYPAAAYFLK